MAARFQEFAGQMSRESDRGSVIVGAAILEDLLDQILVARLVPALEKEDELLGAASAPCGTFSSKIDLAYRVGSMGIGMRSSLHLVRKMRNDAAHAGQHRDLNSPQLQNRLRELFRLNEDLVQGLRGAIDSAIPGSSVPGPADAVSGLVAKVGWRVAWNVLIASLATGLSFSPEQQGRLTPPSAKTGNENGDA
jgi:hypothetical protein